MATEAQRLITMSLGKIHTARAQRGGVNLHKSLLVTTVLFKAKAVFMVEHMNGNKAAAQEQSTPKVTKEEYEREIALDNEQCDNQDTCADNNDQVVPDIECPESGYDDEEDTGDMDMLNKENTPPSKHSSSCSDETDNNGKETNCARRNKRKLTEVEAAVESISPKKSKCDSSEQSCPDKKDTVEPMQTEPVQISNLVRSFNSGFGGLLSSNTQNVQQEQSKVQGNDSIISCSTQIKESFDILSRPAIALSV